ncbi:hypothetical protein [Croceivirga radicis]|uniref:Chromosome partitioning protein ParA n=1 Tax=Croceivirga radicis TaxID=1929488 RepID=A0A1V6LWK9_9FLAO|nr:hypothetical protein [Croceivirga radicis]OQD44427.1 hypothetical protein BUL40_02425 [Croceivirga radicis]
MESQDTNFNYKIILAALVAVIIAILIAFYYSYAQSQNQLTYLEDEKKLLVKDLSIMKAEVDRLAGLNEVSDIELRSSQYRIDELMDSVGRLNFNILKLKDDRKALRKLEAKFDSLKIKNNFLRYNNRLLTDKYQRTVEQIEDLRGRTSSLAKAEEVARKRNVELSKELKVKSYLKMQNSEGAGFRLRAGRPLKTNKADVIEKLRGCVTILGNPNERGEVKIIYFQFLDPDMAVIEDNANLINVGGNTYSKRVEVVYMGKELSVCDAITIPEGSLAPGIYTLNVFEDERLLSSTEFQLK